MNRVYIVEYSGGGNFWEPVSGVYHMTFTLAQRELVLIQAKGGVGQHRVRCYVREGDD